MKRLLSMWENEFYTNPLLLICTIISFYISIRQGKKFQHLRFFSFYFGSYIILTLVVYIGIATLYHTAKYKLYLTVENCLDFTVSLIELLIFSYFLFFILKHSFIRKFIILFTSIIIFFFIYLLIVDFVNYHTLKSRTLQKLYITESLFLLFPCIGYCIELFRYPPVSNLLNEPSFWVITGIFFFIVCTLPTTILSIYLRNLNYAIYLHFYAITNVCYILLFIMICKAFLCKPTQVR